MQQKWPKSVVSNFQWNKNKNKKSKKIRTPIICASLGLHTDRAGQEKRKFLIISKYVLLDTQASIILGYGAYIWQTVRGDGKLLVRSAAIILASNISY